MKSKLMIINATALFALTLSACSDKPPTEQFVSGFEDFVTGYEKLATLPLVCKSTRDEMRNAMKKLDPREQGITEADLAEYKDQLEAIVTRIEAADKKIQNIVKDSC